jgi:asparagine synthase (glutamine-hydrolysing)
MAREHVKVALSADGGDELFNGYSHYTDVIARERSLARIPSGMRKALAAIFPLPGPQPSNSFPRGDPGGREQGASTGGSELGHKIRRNLVERLEKMRVMMPELDRSMMYDLAMSSWTPWQVKSLLGSYQPRETVEECSESFADQMARCDLRHFLPDDILVKVDRTTMACGLEGREPLLDHRVAEFALQLPLHLRRGELGPKHLLRKILYKYVPRELIERPKQGFAVPLASWMRGDLAPLIDEYLSPSRIRDGGLFDPEGVARAVRNFREGGPGNDRLDTQKLWYLLSFEMWKARWMDTPKQQTDGIEYARAVRH